MEGIKSADIERCWWDLLVDLGGAQPPQVALVIKSLSANAGDVGGVGSTPRSGRSPGEGNGKPLQYSCLENSMDRGVWWATLHGVAKC